MTDIIDQMMKLYRKYGYDCQTDNRLKGWGGDEAYGIYLPWRGSRPSKAYCFHSVKTNTLTVVIPRILRPENVKQQYGLECWGDPDEFNSMRSPRYYGVIIPIRNGLLNGVYTIEQKKDFFIEMANKR